MRIVSGPVTLIGSYRSFPCVAPKIRSLPSGRWEVGLTQMHFDVRVRCGRAGEPCCLLDYCAGSDSAANYMLLGSVMAGLMLLPEELDKRELEQLFPIQRRKPADAGFYSELCDRVQQFQGGGYVTILAGFPSAQMDR